MNILWVENHARFAEYAVRQFLARHVVKVVPSLATARDVMADARFDIILIDFDLDDGKGTELVQWLRFQHSLLPIIATSSHEEGNRALLVAGADAVCDKLHFIRIADTIEDLMRTQQVSSEEVVPDS